MKRFSYASLHISLIALLGIAALSLSVSAGEPERPLKEALITTTASDA